MLKSRREQQVASDLLEDLQVAPRRVSAPHLDLLLLQPSSVDGSLLS